MNQWSNNYVGTPYDEHGRLRTGCDCYGLICVVYQEELNITLPDYLGYSSVEEHAEIAALISDGKSSPVWVPADGSAVAFDVAVFRRGRLDTHVGLIVKHGIMLHMADEDCAKHADYRTGAWAHRLTGIFRHVDLISRAAP
jgi:cell wall-associated NlpC family hydrolase